MGFITKFFATNQISDFPFVVKIQFFPPTPRPNDQIKTEVKSWGNQKKFDRVFSFLVDAGHVSKNTNYFASVSYHEFTMYFKNISSFELYSQLIKIEDPVNLVIQKNLNYTVTTVTS